VAATEHLYSDEENDDGWALSALRDTVGETRTPDTVRNGLRWLASTALGCPRLVAVLSRSSLGGWRQSDPVMAPAHVLTGGRLIERIYSPVADGLPRERQ